VASARLIPGVADHSLDLPRGSLNVDRRAGTWDALDDVPLDLLGRTVFVLIVVYLIMNRLIPDRFVLPLGISIRPYEIVLVLLGLAWVTWLVVEPKPFPVGLVGLLGAAVFAVIGVAPFLHALNVDRYQANGADRGIFRMFIFAALLLASFHIAFRVAAGMRLLGWVVAATVLQGAVALFEFVTARSVPLLEGLAPAVGLVLDPRGLRGAREVAYQRLTGDFRAVATAPHPIVLSAVIALAIMVVAMWLLHSDERRQQVWLAISAGILMLALPVANSRTGFVILGVAAVPLVVLGLTRASRIVFWSIPMMAALMASVVVSPSTPRLLLNSITNWGQDQNTTVRLARFSRIPELLDDRPFLGAGYLTHDPSIQIFDNAYNLWLIELGIIGLAVFLAFLVAAIVTCWRAARMATHAERMLPIAGVIGVLCLLIGGATFDAWTFDQFLPTALILVGLGLGRSAIILHRARAEDGAARPRARPDIRPVP
jgi:O-antigen ligase